MEIIRSFIAIEIPEKIRSDITQMLNRFASEDSSARWVKHGNLHITLVFLGDVTPDFIKNTQNELDKITKKQKGFDISLKSIGAFPSPHSPRIIWIGTDQGEHEIIDLQSTIESAMTGIGYKPEARKFHPHLTIGRVKFKFNNPKVFETDYQSEVFPVTGVTLFKSTLTPQGPIYEKIQEFTFSE